MQTNIIKTIYALSVNLMSFYKSEPTEILLRICLFMFCLVFVSVSQGAEKYQYMTHFLIWLEKLGSSWPT